jgi:hypothetical protein
MVLFMLWCGYFVPGARPRPWSMFVICSS